jgi:hypothetical protein
MRSRWTSRFAAAGIALGSLVPASAGRTQTGEPISVSSDGAPAQGSSEAAGISDGGRFALFVSSAPNLDPADANGQRDAFVRDRLLGRTELASAGSDGAAGDAGIGSAALSADGRFVVFDSPGGRLTAADLDVEWDVYLRDRERGSTELLSTGGGIHLRPALSADARIVAFASAPDGAEEFEVVALDRSSGLVQRIGPTGVFRSAFGSADFAIAVSGDGCCVAFRSGAPDLVPGDRNGAEDIFVFERASGRLERVSVAAAARELAGPSPELAISADGRFVAFSTFAPNLVVDSGLFLRDRLRQTTEPIDVDGGLDISGFAPALSADGRRIAFQHGLRLLPEDQNDFADIYVYDLERGTLHLASTSGAGQSANGNSFGPVLGADGRHVLFSSLASDLGPFAAARGRQDVFARELDPAAAPGDARGAASR